MGVGCAREGAETMTTTVSGEAGTEIAAPLSFGALLNGTTVTSGVLRVRPVAGGTIQTWAAAIESATTTGLTLVYTVPSQLAAGKWLVRPFVYVSGVLVTTPTFRSQQILVVPDPITSP
jgi:hypothetical protein